MPKLGATIGKVLAIHPWTAKDGMERGGAPLVKLLYHKGAKWPQWIHLPKLNGNIFQKNQKVLYYQVNFIGVMNLSISPNFVHRIKVWRLLLPMKVIFKSPYNGGP